MRIRYLLAAAAIIQTLAAAPAWAKNPRDFIRDAVMGDNSEIMLGRLAQRAGASVATRDFGRTLVSDHSMAKREVSALARRLGVDPPSRAMVAADAEFAKLQVLTGSAFDREFARYMVDDHRSDIAEFEAQAHDDRGPAGALAQKQLPTLRKHLETAQALARDGGR